MLSQNVGEFNALLDIVKFWTEKNFSAFTQSATQNFLSACTESLAACLIEHFVAHY